MRTASTDEDLSGPSPNWAKFGYSQKEVWNWLYTDNDINQNRRIISTGRTYKIHNSIQGGKEASAIFSLGLLLNSICGSDFFFKSQQQQRNSKSSLNSDIKS